METNNVPQTDIASRPDMVLPVGTRAGFGDVSSFELAQRGARLLSQSTLVPEQFRNNMPNCMIALELAQRLGASPLMVMQNLYIVKGRPAWSSQFLISCVNQSRRFTSIQYEWEGQILTDAWSCRAWATDSETKQRVQGPAVTYGMAKAEGWVGKDGSKWKTMPELMMTYRAATFFARTNAPELTMGLPTREEAEDIIDVVPGANGAFAVPATPVHVEPIDQYLADLPADEQAEIRGLFTTLKWNKGQIAAHLKQHENKPKELVVALKAAIEKNGQPAAKTEPVKAAESAAFVPPTKADVEKTKQAPKPVEKPAPQTSMFGASDDVSL